jgi:multidrug efflux pump subunit AcrA (membrane-fusion protein)
MALIPPQMLIRPVSGMGQNRKCPHLHGMSVLLSRADIVWTPRHVRLVAKSGNRPRSPEPADLSPGLKATFEMPQYPGRKFDATLVTTSKALNATSRSLLVELQADNSDGKLLGGAYCRVDFQIPGDPNMVRLPATALMLVNRGVQVAVLGDGNKVVLKSVQLGRDFGDSVEVTAGLTPPDRVIDSPPETLRTGDSVELAPATPSSTASAP